MIALTPGGFLRVVDGNVDVPGKGTFGALALNSGTNFDIDLLTTEVSGAYGRTELLVKPSGASVDYPAVKFRIDTGGTGILLNESSFLVLAIGGTDVGQFGTAGSDLYFDARLASSNIYFRNDVNQVRMFIETGGRVGIGTVIPGELLHVSGNDNTGVKQLVSNINAGSAAYAASEIRNGASSSHGLRLLALGTGWTTNGAFVRDGAVVAASSNLSGGLSIMSRAAGSSMRFYTGGFADANERMIILAGGDIGIATDTPTVKLDINSDILRLRTAKTPANAGDTGFIGSFCWDSGFIYVCVATDTWKRAAITAW